MVPLPMRSYFLSPIKKDWHHSRAWRKYHQTQFTEAQVLVQDLVEGPTSASAVMPTVTLIHTQTLATPTQYQVEYRTGNQSWLGLTGSHQMRWRCFISAESHDVETRTHGKTNLTHGKTKLTHGKTKLIHGKIK